MWLTDFTEKMNWKQLFPRKQSNMKDIGQIGKYGEVFINFNKCLKKESEAL